MTLQPPRPVGLVQAAVGGTTNQFWSSDDAVRECQGLGEPWEWPSNFRNGTGKLNGTNYPLPDIPTGWNAKIYPLLRTTITGAVWYQGESNTGMATPGADVRQYNCSFQAMVKDWRRKWYAGTSQATSPSFPMGWVQLNSCNRAVWEESRTTPAAPFPTNWSYDNPPAHPTEGDPLGAWRPVQPSTCTTCPRGTPHRGQGDGFPSVRFAFTQSLALPNTFQAVVLDTPSAYGSV